MRRGVWGSRTTVLIISLLVAVSVVPFTQDRFYIYLGSLIMIFSMYALSYNLLFGYAGLLSFGHALFFSTGAYATAIVSLNVYRDPLVGLLFSVAVSVPLALAVGLLTLRHTRIYFAILTLALGMAAYALLVKWRSVTGGSDGLVGIPKRGLLVDVSGQTTLYYFIFSFYVLVVIGLYVFINSRWGLLVRALGANEERLPFSGHSILRIRLMVFTVSGLVAALAGSLYAVLMGVVTPDIAYWTFSAEPLIMTLLGGSTYYLGPVLGAFILVTLTTVFARFAEYWMLFLGIAIIAIVLGLRGGVGYAIEYTVSRLLQRWSTGV